MVTDWMVWLAPVSQASLIGLLLSIVVEQALKPRPRWCDRPFAAWLIHAGVWLCLFTFELLLFARPSNAVANALALQLLVTLISNAKFASLREPFVFQDFEYFVDAFRHPRLYLPFLGLWRALAAATAITGCVYAGLLLEAPLWTNTLALSPLLFIASLLLGAALLVCVGSLSPLRLCFDAEADLLRFGLFTALWRYMLEERRPLSPCQTGELSPALSLPNHSALPHIVAVQSESFFDVRRLYAGIRPDLLDEFDRLQNEALFAGKLDVPAWGANTVRTEFAFLSGTAPEAMGVHRFNPYRKFAQQALATLPQRLKQLGYRTLCIHPYHASFYQRDRIIPQLGFDEFIDITRFNASDYAGPYIGDLAIAEKIDGLLKESTQPLFIFAVTMENHGPLHWETVAPVDVATLYRTPPKAGWSELTIYLRHLRNANQMMKQIRRDLCTSSRPGVFCLFGDHRPIMPGVYADTGCDDKTTDYFVWASNGSNAKPSTHHTSADKLADLILQTMNRNPAC